jgi:hypothetical protein
VRLRKPSRAIFWLIGLVAVAALAVGARTAFGSTRGLTAEYFSNDSQPGSPALRLVAADISTMRMTEAWRGAPPLTFTARWFGYLAVGSSDFYTFSLTSDDGSSLTIDGSLVVDNRGVHGTTTQTGRVWLDRGPHFVLVEYAQAGGFYEIAWSWAREGRTLSPVPRWLTSPQRVQYGQALLVRALDWIARSSIGLFALVSVWAGITSGAVRRFPRAASLAFFIGLAVLHTWPLATDPRRLSRNDNGDTMLNEWILAWVAHQAPRAPQTLYDANIFHPERHTLAYSEVMIVQSAMGAPLRWLGASPVLVYNLVLLAGFILTGWIMSLVVVRWTGDRVAGLTAGILAAFNAHTLTRIPHLQAQHGEFLPLALLALDSLLRDPRAVHALRLALWFALQALTSIYLLVATVFALAAAALARPEDWWGTRFRRVATRVALAGAVASLALLPFILPYWRVYQDQGMARSLTDALWMAASWSDYLRTPGRLHQAWWSYRWSSGSALFPGFVGLALVGVAVAYGVAFRDRRARMCLAFGVCGVVLSFGAKVPGYTTLYELLPLLHAIRAPVRFGYLAIVAVAILAGFGIVEIRRRLSAGVRAAVSAAVLVLVTIEPLAAPLYFTPFYGVPPIYRRLRSEPDAVVVEMPLPEPRSVFHNARYMLNATEHWRPMLNGYSGFVPYSYREHFDLLGGFPNSESIAALQTLGVTHVFVHLGQFGPGILDALDGAPALRKISVEGSIALYAVARATSSAPGP